jgi:transposase
MSESLHSRYTRSLQDLPWQGRAVVLRIRVRRFRCRNDRCRRKVFSEALPRVAQPHARRTDRVREVVRLIGYTAGGLPASRILDRLAIPVSDDTVIRMVKAGAGSPDASRETAPVTHLGVDDWAWKKGQSYGTILVDLDRHRVIDLLPGRSADELRRWLEQHQTVQVISRDRCVSTRTVHPGGAPEALQVADRFHLLTNLSAAVERALEARRGELHRADHRPQPVQTSEPSPPSPPTQLQIRSQERRQRRRERYEKVVELYRVGYSQRAIAEALEMQRKTVRRWLRSGHFPERKKSLRKPPKVEEHALYLEQRWQQGCHNATTLFREIRARGYQGGRSMVARHVTAWRKAGKPTRPAVPKSVAPRHAAILACRPPEQLSVDQRDLLQQLTGNCVDLGFLRTLAGDFRGALARRDSSELMNCIRTAAQCGIGPMVRFAFGLKKDLPAVIAAVETKWSNGQVEGQVNRLKAIKRQMYGRAGFYLLRSRILPLVPGRSP